MYPFAYTKKRALPPQPPVKLKPQIRSPVTAIDRRWCFATLVTLHIESNLFTGIVRVRNTDNNKLLLEIHRLHSHLGDLFHVVDVAAQDRVLTIEGIGCRGRFEVFRGPHKPSLKRKTGPILVDATRAHVTAYFNDAEARRPTRAIVSGQWGDRTAVASIHHAVSSQPVARINRPEHAWLKLPYYTLEIAAGVDVLLPVVLWLCRWAQYKREQPVTAYSTVGSSLG